MVQDSLRMKPKRREPMLKTVIAFVVIIYLSFINVNADTVEFSHQGDQNPTDEGWTADFPSSLIKASPGGSDRGAGNCPAPCAYWRINDSSSQSGTRGAYFVNLPDNLYNHSKGWALRARVKRVQREIGVSERSSYATTLLLRSDAGGQMFEFSAQIGIASSGQQILRILGSGDIGMGWTSEYQLIEIVFDPIRNAVDYLVNGKLVLKDFEGFPRSATIPKVVYWGSGSSGDTAQSFWNKVEFVVAPDTDGDGITDSDERTVYLTNPYLADSDEDGAIDEIELSAGSDPLIVDTDEDGLTDGFEIKTGLSPTNPDDAVLDSDNDGLNNLQEQDAGADPFLVDSDGDTLNDYDEVTKYKSNPSSIDSDGDTISDGDEVNIYFSDPTSEDSDKDALSDAQEIELQTSPILADSDEDGLSDGLEVNRYQTSPIELDTDGDQLTDGFEVKYGFDPLVSGQTSLDPDLDGLTNLQEQEHQSSPNDFDTDDDGLSDGDEVIDHGSNPILNDTDSDGLLDAFEINNQFLVTSAGEQLLDNDSDGLTNLQEQTWGTNPHDQDSDGDGELDGQEVNIIGTNPTISDNAATPIGVSGKLTFEVSDQPLFVNSPPESRINLIPEELVEKTMAANNFFPGENKYGQVHTVDSDVPLWAYQDAWDQAMDECRKTRSGPTHSSCSNYSFTPSESLCRDGGSVDIHAISVQCCVIVGIFDLTRDYPNCRAEKTYTLKEINDDYADGQIPASHDIPQGLGARPTQTPPNANFSYQVGAEVTVEVDVDAELIVSAESNDSGTLNLNYVTNSALKADKSSVYPGEKFKLWVEHRPVETEIVMSSVWAAIGFNARYEINVGASANADYWSIDPNKDTDFHNPDFQVQGSMNLLDETFEEIGEFVGFTAGASDSVEFRLMHGVERAPELMRDVTFEITPSDIDFNNPDVNLNIPTLGTNIIPPGTGLAISIPNPLTSCPFKFALSSAKCLGIQLLGAGSFSSLSQEMLNLRLQLPEVNTPVSDEFWGGFENLDLSQEYLYYKEPNREHLDAQGRLINSVPNGRRPLVTDYSDIVEGVTTDKTLFSSDTVRFQWDLDGTFSSPATAGFFDKTVGNDYISFTFGLLDMDVELWAGIDQTLTFDPRLVADISFNQSVEIRIVSNDPMLHQEQSYLLSAGGIVTLPALTSTHKTNPETWLEVTQPSSNDLNIEANYSFRENAFINDTDRIVTIAPSMTMIKLATGGLPGILLKEQLGFSEVNASKVVLDYFPKTHVALGDTVNEEGNPIDENTGEEITPRILNGSASGNLVQQLTVIGRDNDRDGDGLLDSIENSSCTNWLDLDSDDDGIGDGIEDANRNGVVDLGETDPCNLDTDNDGEQDGTEKGAITGISDPDGTGPLLGTDLNVFVPDSTPTTHTDPEDADDNSVEEPTPVPTPLPVSGSGGGSFKLVDLLMILWLFLFVRLSLTRNNSIGD